MMVRGRTAQYTQTNETTRTRMKRRGGLWCGLRMRVVHRGALILAADRTRARARRQRHRYRDSSHSGHSIQPYNHHYISQQPPAHPSATTDAPLLPVLRSKNKSSRSSTSKSSSSSVSSTKRSRSLSAPLSPPLVSPVAPPHSAYHLLLPLLLSLQRRHFTYVPLRASLMGPRLQTVGIERRPLLDFQVQGLVVHVM
jgi:hypothetical protein